MKAQVRELSFKRGESFLKVQVKAPSCKRGERKRNVPLTKHSNNVGNLLLCVVTMEMYVTGSPIYPSSRPAEEGGEEGDASSLYQHGHLCRRHAGLQDAQ